MLAMTCNTAQSAGLVARPSGGGFFENREEKGPALNPYGSRAFSVYTGSHPCSRCISHLSALTLIRRERGLTSLF